MATKFNLDQTCTILFKESSIIINASFTTNVIVTWSDLMTLAPFVVMIKYLLRNLVYYFWQHFLSFNLFIIFDQEET